MRSHRRPNLGRPLLKRLMLSYEIVSAARIHDARIAFARGQSDDPVIAPLLEAIEDHAGAAKTLLNAERQMDEAGGLHHIHGFCQRMLTQNAFESGSRFDNEFVTDESHLKAQGLPTLA